MQPPLKKLLYAISADFAIYAISKLITISMSVSLHTIHHILFIAYICE